ncbi:MAG: penicillin-insensitive murein endopeptidase [Flavobacteriaceae bacterium]
MSDTPIDTRTAREAQRQGVAAILAAIGLFIAMILVGIAAFAASPASAEPAAKTLFGGKLLPADLPARAIGSYARGCMAGGVPLPVTGDAWQVMRLERNRNWGNPALIAYLERLARDARDKEGWPGLLVGDIAQPRGGPMLTGHASHQIGLDADIWLRPMPDRVMSPEERSEKSGISAVSMLAEDKVHADPAKFTDAHKRLIRRAASYPQVARIFLHPGLKQALCDWEKGDRGWLNKVRPWWGHYYHFHVRLSCPAGVSGCENQAPPPPGDGCGKQIDDWMAMLSRPVAPPKPGAKPKPKAQLTMKSLPDACRDVLAANAAMPGGSFAAAAAMAAYGIPLPTPRPRRD